MAETWANEMRGGGGKGRKQKRIDCSNLHLGSSSLALFFLPDLLQPFRFSCLSSFVQNAVTATIIEGGEEGGVEED